MAVQTLSYAVALLQFPQSKELIAAFPESTRSRWSRR
jgi:hypothetical protein